MVDDGDDLEDCVSKAACPRAHQGQHVGEAKQRDDDHLLKSPCKQIFRLQSLQWTEWSSLATFFMKRKIFHQCLFAALCIMKSDY